MMSATRLDETSSVIALTSSRKLFFEWEGGLPGGWWTRQAASTARLALAQADDERDDGAEEDMANQRRPGQRDETKERR